MRFRINHSAAATGAPEALVLFPKCDPLELLADVFGGTSLAAVSAEDIILAWLLSLPDEMDPSTAAQPALEVLGYRSALPIAGNRARLVELLEEITRCPLDKLLSQRDVRRRRRVRSA